MENTKASFFSRERVIGILLYFAVVFVLSLVRFVFSKSEIDIIAIITYALSGVLFFVAFFGLSSKSYKVYAQGALVGWLINFVLALVFGFLSIYSK